MNRKVNIPTTAGSDVDHVSATVSQKLRSFRRRNGLSLDELSRRSGVSKGMLVEIEKGGANPSIATLCRTASALGVSVADFVDVAPNVAARIVGPGDASVLWQGPKGGTATLLVGTNGPDMIELWRWTLFPEETFESPGHSPGTLELLHVETGDLTLKLADSDLVVPAGSSILARTDDKHAYLNCGTGPLCFIMAVTELQRPRARLDI